MARDRVKVTVGRTLNLGNYESCRIDVGLEADVQEGEGRKDAFKKLWKEADAQLDAIVAPLEEKLAKVRKS